MVQRASEYSIAAVSKLTGVGCHALRVWERRYGFPVPRRSPSGHRRFGADQVETLVKIAREINHGRSVGEVMSDVRAGNLADRAPEVTTRGGWEPFLDCLVKGDLAGAESEMSACLSGLSLIEQVREILGPSLIGLGERWYRGECEIFQEHCASSFLRRKLHVLLDTAQTANPSPTRKVIVGTVEGDRHEGGVLMTSLFLELAGWRAFSLGVDLPAREYQKAVDLWKPDALCLSFALSRNINKRFGELGRIRNAPVYVGGRSILNYQSLARKSGLHPLVGPVEAAVSELMASVESASPRSSG